MGIGEIALPDNGDDGDGDRGDDESMFVYLYLCIYVFVYLHFCICICVIFSADDRADTSSSPGLPTYESSHATSPDCPSMSLPAGW